ncbi:hypothetical protein IWQ52_001321 [Labrenzia sp. EL_159]|nr:hypothetical protein [Labrenzia sp. EL_162]MBG6193819.1 hypothetical protein [Labrenzia sp. EL_159]
MLAGRTVPASGRLPINTKVIPLPQPRDQMQTGVPNVNIAWRQTMFWMEKDVNGLP